MRSASPKFAIMGLALLIYALAERQLCLALEKNNETIPDQKGKPTSKPTIRWVFQTFEGIDLLSVWVDGEQTMRKVLNLRPVHQLIIRLFSASVIRCYLFDP
jgi:transposase